MDPSSAVRATEELYPKWTEDVFSRSSSSSEILDPQGTLNHARSSNYAASVLEQVRLEAYYRSLDILGGQQLFILAQKASRGEEVFAISECSQWISYLPILQTLFQKYRHIQTTRAENEAMMATLQNKGRMLKQLQLCILNFMKKSYVSMSKGSMNKIPIPRNCEGKCRHLLNND